MSEWLPIESAPKDGTVVLSWWRDDPVFISWFDAEPEVSHQVTRLFRAPITKVTRGGWHVMIWGPRSGWGIHGNCAPFNPSYYMPFPSPPDPARQDGGAE